LDQKHKKEFWKQLDKVLNESSTLLIKENFSNFVKQDKPSKPTSPTVAFSEFSASGNMEGGTGTFPSHEINPTCKS
jgi:hypothetical protein